MDRILNIRTKLEIVQGNIFTAARRVDRNPEDVKLVVVSKGQPMEVMHAAVEAGVRIFGENYPEESLLKINALHNPEIQWHMIGHLQSRKAGLVAENFSYMHSLDSLRLAQKLEGKLSEMDRIMPVLLEFNISDEPTKSGWRADAVDKWETHLPDVEAILSLPHLEVRGLMTMPPLTSSPLEARSAFRKLAALRDFFRLHFPKANWEELSMGTSGDYWLAVEEGATFVRIGTSILGPRPPRSV
jgi:pyridoxal phosphate enzyme (YggS family)